MTIFIKKFFFAIYTNDLLPSFILINIYFFSAKFMHHKKFSIILLLLLIKTQLNNGFTFYEWMERNSYICQDNNSLEPSFLSDEDAIQFNCESLCGNPLLTNQACSRSPSEPNSSPSCTLIPELCLMNFNQEFNDEKTFHLFLNRKSNMAL